MSAEKVMPNNIDWLCGECKSNNVEVFGGVLMRAYVINMPIKVWAIQNPEEVEYQCLDCNNKGYMHELIEFKHPSNHG